MSDFISKALSVRAAIDELSNSGNFRWVALRSESRSKKCSDCIGKTCKNCLGTGFLFVDKLIQAYSYLATYGRQFLTEIGSVDSDTHIYITKDFTNPKEGDFIAELDLDEETLLPKQPFKIRRLFKIEDAKAFRGEEGKIEFWKMYTEEHNFDLGKNIK